MAKTTIMNVASSRVKKLQYQGELNRLIVTYTKGGTYSYQPIYYDRFMALTQAKSIGKAIQDIVSDKSLDCRKIEEDEKN